MTGPAVDPPQPLDLERHLHPRERFVAQVRWHPVAMLKDTLVLLGLLALLGWVAGGRQPDSVLGPWLTVAFLGVVLWYSWRLLLWRRDRLVVTDRRLLLISGLLGRRVAVMPLQKVTDLTYEQVLSFRLFDLYGWGTFVFESAGQDQAFHRIRFVPRPDELYHQLTEEIFGDQGIYGRPRRPAPSRDSTVQDD